MADVMLVGINSAGKTVPVKVVDDGANAVKPVVDVEAQLELGSAIDIGDVAIKNNDSADHVTVAPDGQAVDATYPLEGMAIMGHDGTNWKVLKTTSGGELVAVVENRADFKVREIDTGGVLDTPVAGPSQAVPNGFGVAVIADAGNTETVQVASVGESGTAGQFFVLQPDDRLPITLKVQNMNQIEVRSVLGTNEIVKLIVEV